MIRAIVLWNHLDGLLVLLILVLCDKEAIRLSLTSSRALAIYILLHRRLCRV